MTHSPLDEVINTANNYKPPCPVVNGGVNQAKVIPPGVLGVGRGFYYLDEGLIMVEVRVEMKHLYPSFLATVVRMNSMQVLG